jgi:hypothetical protein
MFFRLAETIPCFYYNTKQGLLTMWILSSFPPGQEISAAGLFGGFFSALANQSEVYTPHETQGWGEQKQAESFSRDHSIFRGANSGRKQ